MPTARRCRERRYRTILLWMAGVFIVAQVGAGLLFDHVFPRARFVLLYRILDMMEDLPRDPAIVCLGSSRTGTCLMDVDIAEELRQAAADPALDVFNLSMPCGDPIVQEYVLDELLWHGHRPRLAVVEISPEYFCADSQWLSWHVQRQLRWADTPAYFESLRRQGLLSEWLETRLLPLYAHRKGLGNALVEATRHHLTRTTAASLDPEARRREWERIIGMTQLPTPAQKQARDQESVDLLHAYMQDYRSGGPSLQALNRLLDRCRQQGIDTLLWVPPSSEARRACFTPAIEQAFQTEIERLQTHYGCTVVDARTALADDYFLDTLHANRDGALVFSRQFSRAWLEPAWRTAHGGPRLDAVPTSRSK